MKTLADRLKAKRVELQLSQGELARAVHVSQQAVGAIESGRIHQPYPETLMALARHLDVSPAWLQFGIEGLDQLDEDALKLALAAMQLTKEQRRQMRAHTEGLAGIMPEPPEAEPPKQ